MYGLIIPGLALEGSSIPCSYTWGCITGKKMILKIITACNDQSVLQIFSACSENDGMECFVQCDSISYVGEVCSLYLHYKGLVCFLSMLVCCCFQCPAFCFFCDSFLMELGLGTAVPSISFIFLWQRVLA